MNFKNRIEFWADFHGHCQCDRRFRKLLATAIETKFATFCHEVLELMSQNVNDG